MSLSTLRGSTDPSNDYFESFLDSFINSDFKKWFTNNVLSSTLEEYDSGCDHDGEEKIEEDLYVFTKRKRDHYKPPGVSNIDFESTPWKKLINDESVKDPLSKLGKVFRRRFRVPFSVFEHLLHLTKTYNLFGYKMAYKVSIPDDLKLLAVLRTLGRGESSIYWRLVLQFLPVFLLAIIQRPIV